MAADLADRVRLAVVGGYDTPDQIVDDLTELLEYDPAAASYVSTLPVSVEQHVGDLVASALAAHRRQERSFPAETDCDRISAAFGRLRASGILATEDVGVTMSDVRDGMWHEVEETRRRGEDVRGWVAFHRQDVDRVVDTGVLHLAFAAVGGDGDDRAVGSAIVDVLRSAGLTVRWDDDPDRRIELVGLTWQRRRRA